MADDQPTDEQMLFKAFNEIAPVLLSLKQELRERELAMLGQLLGTAPPRTVAGVGVGRPGHRSPPPTQIASREPPSPKDFLFHKQPDTDVERVACLAYYLTHYRGTTPFKTIDISKLNTEAAQRKFANAANTMANATRGNFLVQAGKKGMKQLSADGERYVDALPDRLAAKAALGKKRARRQGRQRTTGKALVLTQEQAE